MDPSLKVLVTVDGGAVTARVWDDSLTTVPAWAEGFYGSIDDLFDVIREALAASAHVLDVTYDDRFHFPTSITIDRRENVSDDGTVYRADRFVDRTP